MKKTIYPYYEVQITSGQFIPGKMKTETKKFSNTDLLLARKKALDFALDSLNEADFDDPNSAFELLKLGKMPTAFSMNVYFVQSKDSVHEIVGDEIHDTLTGLNSEAKYYLDKGLIEKKLLREIYENDSDMDSCNPSYEFASDCKKKPKFDFYTIHVLPDYLLPILIMYVR